MHPRATGSRNLDLALFPGFCTPTKPSCSEYHGHFQSTKSAMRRTPCGRRISGRLAALFVHRLPCGSGIRTMHDASAALFIRLRAVTKKNYAGERDWESIRGQALRRLLLELTSLVVPALSHFVARSHHSSGLLGLLDDPLSAYASSRDWQSQSRPCSFSGVLHADEAELL